MRYGHFIIFSVNEFRAWFMKRNTNLSLDKAGILSIFHKEHNDAANFTLLKGTGQFMTKRMLITYQLDAVFFFS